jgi:hypothetical protein
MPKENSPPTKRQSAKKKEKGEKRSTVSFSRENFAILGAALVSIAAGFGLLASGSITAAPILLVLGYCVLVPIAIVLKR